MLYTTIQNTRSAKNHADQALESTALALAFSAEMELRHHAQGTGEEIRQVFSDRVVAYALIADSDGKILFHTNPQLENTVLTDKGLQQWLQSGIASGRRTIMGTGLPAYEFNYILHRPDGTAELLRLVLHTFPADRIVSQAGKMWWTVILVLSILWATGLLFERMFTRQLRLQEALQHRQQLALIGQMTAVLAHEIRNALGSIKGYAQWVNEKIPEGDPKKAGLSLVLRGTDRIEALVNDLLLFSREETYALEPVTVDPLILEVVAAEIGEMITIEASGMEVIADREILYRAVLNGLQNALQAQGNYSGIEISVHSRGKQVEICIKDQGPGIPEADLPRLFTPFFTTKTNGTGLGLAYSKKVIEGMGGKIMLKNREDRRGAVLSIFLNKAGRG